MIRKIIFTLVIVMFTVTLAATEPRGTKEVWDLLLAASDTTIPPQSSCGGEYGQTGAPKKEMMSEVYVKDFYSSDPASCTTSDVDLNHFKAAEFFKRSKVLDYKTLTDNYPIAPCYIMGTLIHKGTICDWKIFAGSTGSIKCNAQEWFFACDTCEDLFKQ